MKFITTAILIAVACLGVGCAGTTTTPVSTTASGATGDDSEARSTSGQGTENADADMTINKPVFIFGGKASVKHGADGSTTVEAEGSDAPLTVTTGDLAPVNIGEGAVIENSNSLGGAGGAGSGDGGQVSGSVRDVGGSGGSPGNSNGN